MNIVLDTNVFISGIFFSGPPYQVLDAWRQGKIAIILSKEIFDEYQRVISELSNKFKNVNASKFLDLLTLNAIWVEAPQLPCTVSTDPDDDKFLACAIAGKAKIIVSGDKHLLDVSGYRGIEVVTPRVFIETCLQ